MSLCAFVPKYGSYVPTVSIFSRWRAGDSPNKITRFLARRFVGGLLINAVNVQKNGYLPGLVKFGTILHT